MAFGWNAPGLKKLAKIWEVDTVEPWLPKYPLSKPLVIQTLFQILKFQKTISIDFLQNQVINEMPMWFLDLLGLTINSG